MNHTIIKYDATLDGLFTAIFDIYNLKLKTVDIIPAHKYQEQLFATVHDTITDAEKMERVVNKLVSIGGTSFLNQLKKAFFSESDHIENNLLHTVRRSFKEQASPLADYGDARILAISQAIKFVGREKHRMEAFIRFHLIDGDIYYANCEPDCNVLPLIPTHFKKRYADQRWVIYDLNRDYGISYDLHTVSEVKIDFKDDAFKNGIYNSMVLDESRFRESEINYQHLWNQYFRSTNIESRKNMKLHLQHVPKRYWKYLSEKNTTLQS